ncbi:MAG: hypothetical protein RLZZ387_3510 [Chloroflexota bacterium]
MTTPHQGQPLLRRGAHLEQARAAMIMVHGRGASAADILTLADELAHPAFGYLAPQAAGGTWYPNRFIAPLASNEPHLSSALQAVADALAQVEAAGIPPERTVLLGSSQGACLALEFAARNARRYGGVVALSGGLIGPDGTPRDYPGALDGTPVFLGCSDVDFHIPVGRVHEAAEVMGRMGGLVDERIYPGMGHTINMDEVGAVRAIMGGLA